MKKILLSISFFTLSVCAFSQTNPVPYALSNGAFRWDGFEDEGTTDYPTFMQGWSGGAPNLVPGTTAPTNKQANGNSDLFTLTNDQLTPIIQNQGLNGISIRARASATDTIQALAVTLAINTMGKNGLCIRWTGKPIHAFANATSSIQLQYRIGTTGNWTNLAGNEFSITPEKGQTLLPEQFGPTALPVACENQPNVQFRWMHSNVNGALAGRTNRGSIDSIEVNFTEAPKADFFNVNTNLAVQFNDNSKGFSPCTSFSWSWDYGDGTAKGTAQNPSHTYAAPGTYSVKLVTTNGAGKDSITKTIIVTAATIAPDANFNFTTNNLTASFEDASANNPTTFTWNFGDGSSPSTDFNPSHTYASNGTYKVLYTISNSAGTDTISKLVTVTSSQALPQADFNFVIAGFKTDFTDASTNNPTEYFWDFDDSGAISTLANPTYTYNAIGAYNVKLVVTNGAGKDTTVKVVNILSAGISNKNANNIAVFFNNSQNSIEFNLTNKNSIVQVYNALGQNVLNNSCVEGKNIISLPTLSTGAYFLKIIDTKNNVVLSSNKLMVN